MMNEKCKNEISQICPIDPRDRMAMKECINNNMSKISTECKGEIAKMHLCNSEIEKYCPRPQKMERDKNTMMEIKKCIDENFSKLPQNCQEFIQKIRMERKDKLSACEPDIKKFCPTIDVRDHIGIRDCIDNNKIALSPKCKTTLDKMRGMPREE